MKTILRLLPVLLPAVFSPIAFAADQPAPAPTASASSVAKNVLRPTADLKSWQFELNEDAKGTMKVDDGAIAFVAEKVDGTDWHIQGYQVGLVFDENREYVVTFKAKASAKRSAQVYAGVNEDDYHAIGLDELVELTPEWKDYKFTFKAEGVAPKNNRAGFVIGQEAGTVWIKDLVIARK